MQMQVKKAGWGDAWDSARGVVGDAAKKMYGWYDPAATDLAQSARVVGSSLKNVDWSATANRMASEVAGAPQMFGYGPDEYDKFYQRVEEDEDMSLSDFNQRMWGLAQQFGGSISGGGGDWRDQFSQQFKGDNRWQKVKAFYNAASEITGNDDIAKNLRWYMDAYGGMNEGTRAMLGTMIGQDGSFFQKTDDGGYKLPVQDLNQKASQWRQAFDELGYRKPKDVGKWANKIHEMKKQWGLGDNISGQLADRFGGGDEMDPTERLKSIQGMTDTMSGITDRLEQFGIDTRSERRGLIQAMGGGGSLPDPEQLKQMGEILNEAASEGNLPDVGNLFKPDNSGKSPVQKMINMLPDTDSGDFMDTINDRYRDDDGKIRSDRLQKDVQGFRQIHDELEGLAEHADKFKKYAGNLGMDEPGNLTKQYMDDEGNVDFEAMEQGMNFWDETFDFLENNPDYEEKFDRITNGAKKLKGVGFLAKAPQKIMEIAPKVFMDSDGKIRQRSLKAALTVADYGQKVFTKLKEGDPVAWIGAAAVAAPIISGLLGLVTGGGRRQPRQQYQQGQQQPRQQYQQYGQANQASPAVMAARRQGTWSAQPRHMSTRDWMRNFS